MIYSIVLLIIILKLRKLCLIRRKLRELKYKGGGLILSNKIKAYDIIFHKRSFSRYYFSVWGYAEVELKENGKIEVGQTEIKPLEINFTQNFVKYLMEGKEIIKTHDSKEHFREYLDNVINNKIYKKIN